MFENMFRRSFIKLIPNFTDMEQNLVVKLSDVLHITHFKQQDILY